MAEITGAGSVIGTAATGAGGATAMGTTVGVDTDANTGIGHSSGKAVEGDVAQLLHRTGTEQMAVHLIIAR